MNLYFDAALAEGYRSAAQKIRVLTESWVAQNMYCVRCGAPRLAHFPNNQAVADFYCPRCGSEYELKSGRGPAGHKIADGAYDTFIERITSRNNPDFLILRYTSEPMRVEEFWAVPKHFFVPAIVEKRKPLAPTARRAGWTGCNILFGEIPAQGRVAVISHGEMQAMDTVLARMKQADMLYTENLQARGWLLDVLQCVNRIPDGVFTLAQVYAFEEILAVRHPQNQNIRAKIRQQLQVLRDRGVLSFVGRGLYEKI